jgi:enoyl-CoA hydratase/carnithine racemase
MASTPLDVQRDGGVTALVLNRPNKANALSADLVEALLEAVATAQQDGTQLLVLRGEGKAFCGGFDFEDLDRQSDGDLALRLIRIELLLQAIHHTSCATLALCHGGAYGAGADLVCACDQGVAAPGTKFRMPGLRFGIALGTRRFAARVGARSAFEILTASRVFDAEEAVELGLLDRIAEPSQWPDIVRRTRERERLDSAAKARLKQYVRDDMRAGDLAALAESANVPGLKKRIETFRAESARGGTLTDR